MSEIDEHRESDDNSGKDSAKTLTNNNEGNSDESPDNNTQNTTNATYNVEPDRNKLLEPNAKFIRSDNSISSTTSRDLDFCINIMLKEAVKEDKLVKQVFLTMLSAYTNYPLNLAINAPSGEGKSHVLKKVADLFPIGDVIQVTDMSKKAIFHRNGCLALRNEDGEYVNIEGELEQLSYELETLVKELQNIDSNKRNEISELNNQLKENQKRKTEIRTNAVKLIDLSHKILIFLDTPREGIFEALMTLLSHDKYEVEYQFVDTSSKTGLKTKTNVLRGWPTVIFAQAIDYTKHPRYQEIQRRFIITNPRMDEKKYQSVVNHILEKKGSPDFVYQQKILSDEDRDITREIILNIKDDILSLSKSTELGKNNTIVPFVHLIPRILQKNITAQDMTFTDRLMDIVGLLTIINHKKRPYMEIKPAFKLDVFSIPMTLYSDLSEALSIINNSPGGLRPYLLNWYNSIFLELYNSKTTPNSKEKHGEMIVEQRIAVTTQELIEKTKEVMNKTLVSKSLLQEFIYPLLNTGYIDLIRSELDRRAKIYFPAFNPSSNHDEEKNSNLFLFDKKNNLFDDSSNSNINFIKEDDKNQITSKIEEVMRYSSEDGNLTTLRFADSDIDTDPLAEEYDLDKTVEEIVDKYYFTFASGKIIKKSDEKLDFNATIESVSKTLSQEEYLQIDKNGDVLQQNQENNIKNYDFNRKYSNNLFFNEKRNKLIYFCYRCEFKTDSQNEYEKHSVLNHPNKPAYPSLADIEKDDLTPQGKSWE